MQSLTALQSLLGRHRSRNRPFVTLAFAQSLDGSIAATREARYPVSCRESLQVTHVLRAMHRAILVGINTVRIDNPRLDVRLASGPSPVAVVLDSHLRTSAASRLFERAGGKPWIATTEQNGAAWDALQARGATLLSVSADGRGRVDLPQLLQTLRARDVTSLMVEGGAEVLTSFLRLGLADYAMVTISPHFLGGVHALDGGVASDRGVCPRLRQWNSDRVGADLMLGGRLVRE